MKNRRRTLLIVKMLILLSPCFAIAQQSEKDLDPLSQYKKGKELFDNRLYGASEQAFTAYLNSKDNNEGLKADAHYYIAISAMELYQDNAEALLNEFTAQYPENPKARLANYYLGKFLYREKNYAKAIINFEKVDASDLSPAEQGEFNFMAGYSYFQKKNYIKAKTYLAKVKDVNGTNKAIASYYYGNIEYIQGNYKDALFEFEKIRNDKKFKNVIPVYITQIYLLQGKYDKVIAIGEEALKDKTTEKYDEIKLYVAESYFRAKDYSKAAGFYKTYTNTLSPHHAYQYGYSLMKLEQYSDAIGAFNTITINEDSLGQDVSYNLGNAYIQTGDKEKARTAYQFASGLEFIPILKGISLLNYAKLSFELNFPSESIDAFKLFLKNYPKAKHAEEAKEILAQILITSESPKEALDIIESIQNRSSKLNEAYQRVLYSYGLSLFNNHKYDEALENFGKSLKYPIDKKIKALDYFWAGESRYKLGDFDKALSNYKNFLAVDEANQTPYYSIGYYNVGYCYFKAQDYVNARTYFNSYLQAEKNSTRVSRYVDAILRKADCNFVLKHYPDALDGYDDIIASNAPETDYALFQKGLILGLQGNDEQKIKVMQMVPKTSPLADDASFAIAETYKNNEKYDKAIAEYRSLNYNFPKNPYYVAALLNIGQLYINLNQDSKAIEVFKNIRSQYPNSPQARESETKIQRSYIDRGLSDSLDQFNSSLPYGNAKNAQQDSLLYAAAYNNVQNGDCAKAASGMKRYLGKYPNGNFTVDAHYYLADCEINAGSNSAALQDYNYVIAKSPNSFMEKSLKNCATLYYNDKNYSMALQRFKQLEEIGDKQNVLLALNGELRASFNTNEYEPCIETGNKILNLAYADEPSKHAAQFYMAKSNLALNRLEQALPGFETVFKNDKSEMGAEAMYEVAEINYLQGKYKEAEDLVFQLKDRYVDDNYWKAKAFILLSDILVKTGDDFQAKSTLKTIIDKYDGEDLRKIASDKLQLIKEREAKGKPEIKEKGTEEEKQDGN